MTTVFEVRSSICGNKTTIVVEKKDRARMTVSLETSCSKLKAYSEGIKELDFKAIGKGFTQNPIYVHAVSSHITPNCLVPCGVVMATWAEFEMMSKNLLRQVEPQSIIFIK
jgi:hypothetical protein